MADYTLYYWPLPFRGQFVRSVLAHVHANWVDADIEDVIALKDAAPAVQLVPHMGPPVLTDHNAGRTIAQTEAILMYLGTKHELIPTDPLRMALSCKVIADANDVLYEMTLHNGAQLWTQEDWDGYRPRLKRWMEIFEETGRRYGLTEKTGYFLGTDEPSLADLTAYSLWGVMTAKLPPLRQFMLDIAPALTGLSDRISELPTQTELRKRSDAAYGDAWCSGQIEASLRAVI